jgi:hypothetical protein
LATSFTRSNVVWFYLSWHTNSVWILHLPDLEKGPTISMIGQHSAGNDYSFQEPDPTSGIIRSPCAKKNSDRRCERDMTICYLHNKIVFISQSTIFTSLHDVNSHWKWNKFLSRAIIQFKSINQNLKFIYLATIEKFTGVKSCIFSRVWFFRGNWISRKRSTVCWLCCVLVL